MSFVQCSAMLLLAAASGELIGQDVPRRSTSAVSTASARCQIKMAHLLSLLQLCICSLVVVVAVVAVAAAVAAVAAKTAKTTCSAEATAYSTRGIILPEFGGRLAGISPRKKRTGTTSSPRRCVT